MSRAAFVPGKNKIPLNIMQRSNEQFPKFAAMWGEKWKIARDDQVIPPPPAKKGGTLLFGINAVAESAVKPTRRKQPKSSEVFGFVEESSNHHTRDPSKNAKGGAMHSQSGRPTQVHVATRRQRLQDGYRANTDTTYLHPSCMVDPVTVDPQAVHQNMSSQPYYDVAFNASSPSCSSESTLYTPSSRYSPLHSWVDTRGPAFNELAQPASTSAQMSIPYQPLNTCNVASATSNSTQWTSPYGLTAEDGGLCTQAMGDTVQRGQLDDIVGNLCSELRAILEWIILLLSWGHPAAFNYDYPSDYDNCITWNEQSYMDGPLYW
ncbi:hypothetical protein C8Q74DRAFT_1365320 [Fomes fomentarius]|nr:hypothetical protein C8Q74DRAFT_1365320 [Fomes fomentarius]